MQRRKHHKLAEFPPELVSAVKDQLQHGATYAEVTAWLNERGQAIGKSSVARYARDFQATIDYMKFVRDQMAVIVQQIGLDSTAMQDVATQLALTQLFTFLMKTGELKDVDHLKAINAVGHLTNSSARMVKLRAEQAQKEQEKAAKINAELTRRKVDPETIRYVREELLGLAP